MIDIKHQLEIVKGLTHEESNVHCAFIEMTKLLKMIYEYFEDMKLDDPCTSEDMFNVMDRSMPGEKAVRFNGGGSEALQAYEVEQAKIFLNELRCSYFLKDLDYYARELIKGRIEALIYEIERYT